MIRYRHFVVPPDHPNASTTDSAKLVLQHPQATVDQHAFDIVLELGAEFNQGRYIDPDHLAQDENIRNGYMLCEIVFQYYSPLLVGNYVATNGRPGEPGRACTWRRPLPARPCWRRPTNWPRRYWAPSTPSRCLARIRAWPCRWPPSAG